MDWRDIVERLVKVEKDVQEWSDGLQASEREEADLRAQLKAALGKTGSRAQQLVAEAMNGGGRHKPSHAPPPPVKKAPRLTHDYQRRHRVLELMQARGGFITNSEVLHVEKATPGAVTSIMSTLAKEGLIHRVGRARYALGPAQRPAPGVI